MIDRFQSGSLLLGAPAQQEAHMSPAKIRRKMDLRNRCISNTRIGQLIVDEFIQFLAEACGDSFAAAEIQISA